MKRIKILGLIFTLIITIFGCEEEKDPAGLRDVGVAPAITDLSGILINGEPSSSIQFNVDFEIPTSVDKAEIVVSLRDNFERLKVVDLASFPADITITLGDVINALGVAPAAINAGDGLYFEVEITKNGLLTRSNAALSVIVLCEYEPALAFGGYNAVSVDWGAEGIISITADPSDPYTVYVSGLEAIEGLNEDQGPLVMHIDPASFVVTADETVIASEAWGFGAISYSGTGQFNSCTGEYVMDYEITLEALGSLGSYRFNLTRTQ